MSNRIAVSFRFAAAVLITVLIAFPPRALAQEVSLEAAEALDEWRWGVIAYNDGFPGKSLLSMERAVSLNPTDPIIREWLGRAYWRSGMEDAALEVWDRLFEENAGSSALRTRAEALRRRLSGEAEIPVDDEWVPLTAFDGQEGDMRYFERPSSSRSAGDGSGALLVASYAGGEILRIDVNGTLVDRYEGGVEGFDRPFDILPTGDGRVLVSEFQADRITVLSMAEYGQNDYDRGYRIETWGESGTESAHFLGPQYMALSPDGKSVYVSDWGNRRVSKWGLDGQHVLNLEAGGRFDGFEGPTGIACKGERVYVADSLRGHIDVFDPSGNYLGPLVEEGLDAPEGLFVSDGYLLIADGADIKRIDLNSGAIDLEATLGAGKHRITTAFPDENGNLVVCDFDTNRIVLLTPLSTLYGGLEVTLDRVRADAFPDIAVDLTVRDRRGQPISGLDASNFRVFDGDLAIGHPMLDWSSSEPGLDDLDIVAVIDLFGNSSDIHSLVVGIDDLTGELRDDDSFFLIGAGENAVVRDVAPGGGSDAFEDLLKSPAGNRPIAWDASLRLAATRLAPSRNRKAVVAFVNEPPASTAFDRYGLIETARLMANNGVVFYPVYADDAAESRELNYIAEQTGGESSYLYRPEGSGIIAQNLRTSAVGRYTVIWRSPRDAGFGREFMPVSVEVIYINKSGRDESGTFTPLH